jgi:SAM-dependent methyltransferase
MMSDAFDAYGSQSRYEAEVERSIAFAHVGHEMFVRAKADLLIALMRRRLGDLTGLAVLDIGCGVGAMQRYVAPLVRRSVGVDASAETVAEATRLCRSSEILVADRDVLPFAAHTFDVAFAVNVFHHVDPPKWHDFAQDALRVVRPGGLMVVFEHNPLNPLTRVAVDRCEFDEGVRLLSQRTVTQLLEPGGRIVERRYILFLPRDRPWARRVDAKLGWLPLGAQHMVAVEVEP